ncbi:ATP-binding protein (plasmid) [Paraburkholderia sp. PREW-6R]|uniref:hybrid sensor histidine kinase/response regulator n=1 Tax=Paraburkholderia sp. PREW-6R TaxID=3141544 RepID=UPI0031F4CD77
MKPRILERGGLGAAVVAPVTGDPESRVLYQAPAMPLAGRPIQPPTVWASRWFRRPLGEGAHRQLIETADRLLSAVEAAGVGTFHAPLPLGPIHWNAQCRAHFWMPEETDIHIDAFYSRLHPDDRLHTHAAVEATVTSGTPYDVEYRVVSPAGEIRWIRAKGAVKYSEAGIAVRFDGVTIDISEQKRVQFERDQLLLREQLRRAEAEQQSELKDTFISMVSHELRTPLNAIQMWTDLLERQSNDRAFVSRCIEVVKRNILTQVRLVDDLLDATRIAASKMRLDLRPLSLTSVLGGEVEALAPLAAAKNVGVNFTYQGEIVVPGDELRLRQVFSNVLGNALKHTPAGGKINVSQAVVSEQIVVEVSDTGEGIPADRLESIFDMFSQVDTSMTRRHGGLGLGLAISRGLIDLHGGSIVARSEGNALGATLIITLPLGSPEPDDTKLSAATSSEPAAGALRGRSVLVVEDEPDSLEAMQELLASLGMYVITADCASKARQLLAGRSVDVIFSDINMPGEDGIQFVRWLRARNILTPVFATTALATEKHMNQATEAGFTGYLTKPLGRNRVIAVLLDLMSSTKKGGD